MKKRFQRLWALAVTFSICVTTMTFAPLEVVAASGQFATCLSEITVDTDVTNGYDNFTTSENLSKYLGKSGTSWAYKYAKTANGIKFFDYGGFDEWIPSESYYYGAYRFNLGEVTDVYGANQGIYEYNVDFNLNLSANDSYSSINNRRCFVLGFGNGVTISPSALNFYNDKITQSEVHTATDNQVVLYDGTVVNGTYHLKYTFTAGASAADSRVIAVLTTPSNSQIILLNNEKLRIMPGEINSSKTWDTATETNGTTTLGWMTVATRMPWSTSYIEITDASFRAYDFDDWFENLPTLTNQSFTTMQANTIVNNSKFVTMNEGNQSFRLMSTAPNSFKVSSNQSWDETGASDRRSNAILKLDQVDDIYGANQGTYLYDVDFNLTLTGEGDRAPLSTAGSRKKNSVYLGFFGGTTNESMSASYSVINFYRDKAVDGWERDGGGNSDLATFDGDGLANGKYNIKYEYVAGASAASSTVSIVLTKYQQDGVNLESTPVMVISKKLNHMLAEAKETWSEETKASLGWLEIGVRTPHTDSGIEITRADFGEKPIPTTVDEYFARLPGMNETTATNAIANSYVNVTGVASLDVGDRGAYYNASSVPGALRLISNYSWENNFKRFLLTMRLGDNTNIYGTDKVYRYTADFKLHFNEDAENHYLCRLPGTYTDENDQTNAARRFIGIFNFGSNTNLLLFRNGMTAHDGVPGAIEFDDLLEDGVYTIQILYYAGSNSQESKVSVDLIYKGADGNSEPVVIPCYEKVKTKFMVGESSQNVAVSTGILQDLQVGIGGAPAGSYMEITGASLESQMVPDRLTYKSATYSKAGNTLTVTGVYDHDFGYELHPEMLYIQHIGLFSADEKELLVYGNAQESLLGEGDDQNWTVQLNYTGALSAGMKIKLFVWDEENNPLIDDHSLTVMSVNLFSPIHFYVSAKEEVLTGDLVTSEGEIIFEDTEHMSNEDFFGKWDSVSNSWEINPKINYEFAGYNKEASDKLLSVGNAVKENDYDKAKELILDYYKYINNILPHSYTGDGTKENLAKCELYANNFIYDYMSGATLVDVVDVNQSWSDIEVDVTSHVNETKTSGITIELFDLVKDNAKIEIMSREGAVNGQGFAPYMEIVMNGGIKKTYQTDCDTYVVAGDQKTSIHGTEERLYCEESITSKWNTGDLLEPVSERTVQSDVAPVDGNTKRTKIAFKFDCKESDQIESATLHIYAKNCEADASDGGEVSVSSELAVFRQASTSWTEANCHYQSVQGYYYSWSGEDWIQWKYLKEGSYRFNEDHFRFVVVEQPLQRAYEATGNENYAYHFFRYVMSQLYAFGSKPGAFKSLDNACRLQAYPISLRKMLNSKYMTPTIMANCLKYLWLQMDYQNSKPANTNNWGATEMSGLYICGINFKEFIPKEGNTPYMQYAVEQLGRTANNTLLDYGGSNELALGYTMYAISGLLSPWGVAQNNGITNPDEAGFTEEFREILRGLAKYYCMLSAPGPQTNGHADEHRGNWDGTSLERIGKMTNDDELIFFGTKGASGKMPEITSLYYKDNKNGAMRTGWGKQDLYAHFNVDGAKGSHGQADDLALIIYGYGQCLLSDIEYTSSADGYGEWLISAKGHNTVTVDNENQILYKQTGEIDDWETNAKYDFVKMSTTNYDNAVADRKVLFIKPSFWIVTDHILPNDMTVEHRYDQRWHMMKDSHATYNESDFAVKTNYDSGANITVVPIDTENIEYDSTIDVTNDVNNDGKIDYMDIDVLQGDNYDTILKHGYIVTKDNAAAYQDNIYVSYTRKNKGATAFSTILYPTRPGEKVTITSNPISTNVSSADAQAFSAIIDDGKVNGSKSIVYYALNNDLKKQLRQIDDYETDSSLLYVEKDYSGKLSNIILRDASVIKIGNEYLFKTKNGLVSDVAIEFSGSDARIYSSETVDLKNITFLANNDIKTVYLNNMAVGFKKSGNYIYFDTQPIIEGQQNNTQNTSNNSSSGGVLGGGSGGGTSVGGNVTTGGSVTDNLPSIKDGMTKPLVEPWEKYAGEISGHWAENEIKYLLNKGFIQGDGTSLMLNANVTRAEFATMITNVMEIEEPKEDVVFDDVRDGDWFKTSVSSLASAGIVSGYNNSFYPNKAITREEMARILVLTYEYFVQDTEIDSSNVAFDDWGNISNWALPYIKKAVSLKLLYGDDKNCLRPRDTARRDEAMVVVYRLNKGVKNNEN